MSGKGCINSEFQRGRGRMHLASAYVLHLLNHLVLDFEVCGRGQMNEWKSRVYQTGECQRRARGGVKIVNLVEDGVANLVGKLGG